MRIFYDQNYWVEEFHYLAPFYSPCLAASCVPGSSHFLGTPLPELPAWMSPAMFILIIPGGFRATCYYYRKAYYRAFWFSPPACAVAEPHKAYSGETRFPLIFQNVHRYFFYVVGARRTRPHVRRGARLPRRRRRLRASGSDTVILVVNAILIWGYTLGCHSCRQHHRRAAQALLPPPAALPAVEPGLQAQRPPPAVRLGLAVLA